MFQRYCNICTVIAVVLHWRHLCRLRTATDAKHCCRRWHNGRTTWTSSSTWSGRLPVGVERWSNTRIFRKLLRLYSNARSCTEVLQRLHRWKKPFACDLENERYEDMFEWRWTNQANALDLTEWPARWPKSTNLYQSRWFQQHYRICLSC